MRKIFIIFLLSYSSILQAQQHSTPKLNEIKSENIQSHVFKLASPEMGGRKTGSQGNKMAAKYIADCFREAGLDSLDMEGYFQKFALYKYDNGNALLKFPHYGSRKNKYLAYDFNYLAFTDIQLFDTLALEYVGFGKNIPANDLSDKVVLLLLENNLKASFEIMNEIHIKTGAKIFILGFTKKSKWKFKQDKNDLRDIKKDGEISAVMHDITHASLKKTFENKNTLLANKLREFTSNYADFFVMFSDTYFYEYLFDCRGRKLYRNAHKYQPLSDLFYCKIETYPLKKDTLNSQNVIAFIEGTDKREEAIVVSAHYDHLGKINDSLIYRGADDNASGVASLLEIARVMQICSDNGIRPKRSIVFVAFDSEEEEMLGAKYFVNNSPIPIDSVVVNINLDMLGRNFNDKNKFDKSVFYITDGKNSYFYKRILKAVNKNNDKLAVTRPKQPFIGVSWKNTADHYRFKELGIPLIHLHTGKHKDYHKTTDTPEKINYTKLTEVTKLLYKAIWEISNIEKELDIN